MKGAAFVRKVRKSGSFGTPGVLVTMTAVGGRNGRVFLWLLFLWLMWWGHSCHQGGWRLVKYDTGLTSIHICASSRPGRRLPATTDPDQLEWLYLISPPGSSNFPVLEGLQLWDLWQVGKCKVALGSKGMEKLV